MQIGSNIHTLSQPTKITPSNLEHNTISSTKLESKKVNDPIKFDIRSSEKEMKQVFLYGLYLKCYKRLVKKKKHKIIQFKIQMRLKKQVRLD